MTMRLPRRSDDRRRGQSTSEPFRPGPNRRWGGWGFATVTAIAVAATAVVSVPFAVGFGLVAVLGYGWLRTGIAGEILVGAYWFAFSVYQTVLLDAGWSIPGFFYPFYAAFAVHLTVAFLQGRLRALGSVAFLYVAFLFVVLASFLGFPGSVDFFVFQRVLAYAFFALIALQVTSRKGLVPLAVAAVATSTVLAGWVVSSAWEAGFAYRGDIEADQNFTAMVIGLGIVAAAGLFSAGERYRNRLLAATFFVPATAVMIYATFLLASRGMFVALAIGAGGLFLRMLVYDRRRLLPAALFVVVSSVVVLLPGGSGLLTRFDDATAETGGSRLPLWVHTLDTYAEGDPLAMLVGSGFKSSEDVVQRQFGTLTSVHNAYVQVLYEFGLIGLGLFLGLHGAILIRTWRDPSQFGAIAFGITCFLLGANLTADAPDGFMYWTALGLAAATATWSASGAPRSHLHALEEVRT